MRYDFKCEECGTKSEHHFSMKDKPSEFITECENCGKETNHVTVISPSNIVSGVGGFKVPSDHQNRIDQLRKHHPAMKSSI